MANVMSGLFKSVRFKNETSDRSREKITILITL